MPITLSQARQNAINRRLNALNQNNTAVQSVQQQAMEEELLQTAREQNTGGVLGGVGYTFGKLGTGALRGLEGIWDFVAGGIADLFGADEWAQKKMENSPFDEWNAELDEWYNPSGVMSFVGDVAGGVGQMLPSVAVSLVPGAGPALSTGMFMTSAAGMGVADAARETGELGAKEWLYGTASGAVEGAIEKASGGIGGTRLGTAFGKQIAKSTGGKLAATFVGEGLEEVASDLIDPALRRVTGVDPDAKVDVSQLPNTFLVGGTAGAVLGGGSRLLNARRAGGFNNLNAAEDAASIRDARARGNTLQAEGRLTDKWADTLSKTEKEAATRLSARLQRMDADARVQFVEQNNLGDLFDERGVLLEASQDEGGARDYNRAAISYSARDLAGRVDQNGNSVLKYQPTKAAVREDIAKAAADITQLSGGQSRYVVTDSLGTISDGTKINAFYDPNSGIMYIANDADSAGARSYVVSHEYVHSLEGNGQYSRYANEVLADIAQDPELRKKYDYDKYYARYKEAHPNVEEETLNYIVQTEMIADFTAKELLTNEATVRRLVNRNAGLVRRVYEWVKDKIRALTSRGGSRENIAYLRRAEKLLAKALDNPGGGINVSDMDKYVREEKARRDTQGTDAEAETAEAGEARRLKSNNEPATEIRFSLMNEWSFDENVDDILSMSDADARANAAAGNFISIMKHTPDVILNNVEGAEDLEMIIRFDALYLASREKGALKGHYHDLGAEITKKLPNLISDPDAIVRMDNGRLNIFAEMNTAKGNNGIIAIELNTVKDVNSKRNKYNLVVSAFSTKENYVRNLLQKRAESVEYMKKDLSQLKPQLYEWLASVNERSNGSTIRDVSKSVEHVSTEESSSNNSISQNAENVNSKSQKGKKFALPDTDSDGGKLTAEQREFFGKSAIVDADGKLLKMYHGTAADFTVFDIAESGASNDHTSHIGFWFTPRKAVAENFAEFNANDYQGKKARVQEVYLNIENPKIYAPTDNSARMEELRTENTRLREQLTEEYAELKETVGRLNYMLYFTEDNIFGRRGENDIGYRVDEDYYVQYMKMSPEQAKKAKSLVDAIKKNNEQIKKNETEYYRLQDDDSFLQMSDDLDEFMEWITGTHAHERGFGREHYAATNAREAAEKFRNKLIKEGYDGIWIKDTRVDDSGDQVVAFSPNQIKLVTNKRPTNNDDIRYALTIDGETVSGTVEETNDLVALHNLTEEKLLKVLDLGGFPMPSIAVTKPSLAHDNFGDITVVFGRETIDPQRDSRNKVFSRDAWTPTTPRVEYKLNEKRAEEINRKINSLIRGTDAELFGYLALDESNMTEFLNRNGGDLAQSYRDKDAFKYAYLRDKGIEVTLPTVDKEVSDYGNATIKWVADNLGKSTLNSLEQSNYSNEAVQPYVAQVNELISDYWQREYNMSPNNEIDLYEAKGILREAARYADRGFPKSLDERAAREVINEHLDEDGYNAWIEELFSDVVEKAGLRNNRDMYTSAGRSRSFEALHDDYTLENVVRAMSKADPKGGSWLGLNPSSLAAKLSKEFKSISDMKKAAASLTEVSDDAMSNFTTTAGQMLDEITADMVTREDYGSNFSYWNALDGAREVIGEIADRKLFTEKAIADYMKREYSGFYKYNADIGNKILGLFAYAKQMTQTGYFEAKPRRAVNFSEIKSVLLPDTASERLKNRLDRLHIPYDVYGNTDTERSNAIQRLDGVRFAISDGRYAKQRAQYNAPKVYSRKDAERIVDSILADQLTFQENYGDLTRKNREQIVDTLWKNLNSLPSGKRTSAALKMADYIIENAVLKNYYETLDASSVNEAAATIDVLRPYLHNLDLSSLRDEIRHHYDTDRSPYLLWAARKGEQGITPDVALRELEEQGYRRIKATNAADIFIAMDEAYREAVQMQRTKVKQLLTDSMGEQEMKTLRQEIAKEILRGYDYMGKKSLFARLQEEMRNRLDDAGIKLREQAQLFHIKESIFTKAEALKKKNYPLAFEGFDNVKKTLAKIKYRSDINQSSTRDIIKAFGQFYTESNQALEGYYMPEVREAIDNFLAYDGEGKLDLYELRQVNTVLQAADYLLRNYDKAWIGERKISVTNAASEEINVVKENAPVYRYTPLGRKGRLGQALRSIVDMRTLMRWIDGGNSGTMTEMFEQLAHGSTVQTVTVMDLNEGFEKFLKEHKKFYKDLEKTVKFRFNGAEAEITRAEAISLYLTSLQEDGLYHLAFGGFAVGTETDLRRRYYGKKPYYGKREDVEAYESEALRETRQDMDALFAQFSAAEREYIRIARDLFDNKAKRIKQDVDMKRMGVTNARVENYFPMRVYERGSGRQKPAQGFLEELNLIANQSIHKDRVKGSKQTLMISPVNLVVMNHIRQIAMYNAYAIPLDTFRRVLNKNISVLPDGKTDTAHAVTLKTTIQENAWSDFAKFIEKFELDIQGANTQTDTINKAFRWLRSNYAKFQLGLNIKTMLSQLTSLPMAGSRVGWGNLIKGAISKPNIREMLEYSEWARARVYEGAAYKAQSLVDNLDAVGQLAMKPIGWVDMFTMNRIYNAAKYYIAKRDGLRLDSVECKTKAAEMLEVLGRETQNNSEIAERSAVMRSSNEIMKSIVMFSSDAVKQFSLVVQSFNKISFLKRKIKLGIGDVSALQKQLSAARKEARGALASVATSMTFYVLMGMLVNYGLFAKEPEDDETLVEIFLKNLGGSVTGMIPIVRDLYTFFVEGYELDNFAYDTFNGLTDAVKGISDLIAKAGSGERVTDQEWMLALRKFVYATGQLTGLPTRNIYNQMYGVIKRFSPSAAYEIDSLFYGASTKDLNKAIEKGDDKLSSTITQQLLADRGIDASETVAGAFSALYAEGYSLPSGVRDSITYNGEEISLNARQQGIIIDSYEKAAQEAEGLINSAEWDHQSDAVKANALKLLFNYYYYAGVYEATGAYGDSRALMLGEAVDVAKIAIAYGQAAEMTADVDRKGNTISGTKKAKIQSLVNGLRLTAAQKYILMGYLGYKNANGENVVKGYIRSLGLTQEQQNELLEMSGYETK